MIWHPGAIFLDQCVSEDDEFSHDGCEGDFWFFAVFAQTAVEDGEVGVMARGRESRPVEGFARPCAAAFDMARSGSVSAILGEGSEAGQASDGMAVELSEFGQIGDKSCGDYGADGGDRLKDGAAPGQGRHRYSVQFPC